MQLPTLLYLRALIVQAIVTFIILALLLTWKRASIEPADPAAHFSAAERRQELTSHKAPLSLGNTFNRSSIRDVNDPVSQPCGSLGFGVLSRSLILGNAARFRDKVGFLRQKNLK
jgi:hypothetical protein